MPSAPSDMTSVADTTLTAVLLERRFVSGAVIAVSRKTVELPDDHHVEQPLAAVLNHVLKLWSVVRLGGIGPVNVMPQNRNAVLFSEGGTLAELAFNGFFTLAVGGIAGVNDSFHPVSASGLFLPVIIDSVFSNKSLILPFGTIEQ